MIKHALLARLRRHHKGHINAIPSHALETRYSVCGSTIRRAVLALRLEGHPICSGQDGYFYAVRSAELEATIHRFEGRSRRAAIVKNALSHALETLPDSGQLTL